MTPQDHILLVENDKVDIMTVKRAMRDLKIENPLHVAINGEDALDWLQAADSLLPAIILLDLNMPRMNGIEFLAVIKQDPRFRSIPVIVFTTSNEQKDRLQTFEHSVAGFMVKPVGYDEFLKLLGTVYAYWSQSELPFG